jgi:hypothetical protein
VFAVERERDARVGDRIVRARVQVGDTGNRGPSEVENEFETLC